LGIRLREDAGDHLVERAVALACLLILAVGCYLVMRPFLSALLWGIILTISTWPLHVRLTHALGGRTGVSAALLALAAFAVFLIPLALLAKIWRRTSRRSPPSFRNGGTAVFRTRRPGWRRCRS
jgi:predicted PurR-regulated permease PerM